MLHRNLSACLPECFSASILQPHSTHSQQQNNVTVHCSCRANSSLTAIFESKQINSRHLE